MTLFHGTTPSAASKIVANGFRAGADGAVFFAEDHATAEYFALESQAARGASGATVLKFQVPESVANQLERGVIGEFRGLRFVDIPGGSGYERILLDNVKPFNQSIQNMCRLRVGGF